MQVIIDRFEGRMAVCEKQDRTMINIPRSQLPPEAEEGTVLTIEGENISIDPEATAARRKAAADLLKEMWR